MGGSIILGYIIRPLLTRGRLPGQGPGDPAVPVPVNAVYRCDTFKVASLGRAGPAGHPRLSGSPRKSGTGTRA